MSSKLDEPEPFPLPEITRSMRKAPESPIAEATRRHLAFDEDRDRTARAAFDAWGERRREGVVWDDVTESERNAWRAVAHAVLAEAFGALADGR